MVYSLHLEPRRSGDVQSADTERQASAMWQSKAMPVMTCCEPHRTDVVQTMRLGGLGLRDMAWRGWATWGGGLPTLLQLRPCLPSERQWSQGAHGLQVHQARERA